MGEKTIANSVSRGKVRNQTYHLIKEVKANEMVNIKSYFHRISKKLEPIEFDMMMLLCT